MELFGKRPWIQSAIDQLTLEAAIPCAEMAVACGVDWLEVGTPLILGEGFRAIRELKKIAGDKAALLTDFKARTNIYDVLVEAKANGCDIATISCAGGNDAAVAEGLRARVKCGIKLVADLCGADVEEIPIRARELSRLGLDAVILHYGDDQWCFDYTRKGTDGVLEAKKVAAGMPIGCCCGFDIPGKGCGNYAYQNVFEALKQGADWICVGGALTGNHDTNAYEDFRQLCDVVHSVHD